MQIVDAAKYIGSGMATIGLVKSLLFKLQVIK